MDGSAPAEHPRVGTVRRGERTVAFELIEGGPARLVLIAGTGLPAAYWKLAQTPSFRSWATCLLVDNAGVGGTDALAGSWCVEEMARDVGAVLDHVGWTDAHIAGHSLGSAIAMSIALQQPGRVASLSLHSTWASTSEAPHVRAWLEARQATSALGDAALWMRYAFFLVSPEHFAQHGFDDGALGAVSRLIASASRTAHVGQYEAGLRHEAGARLRSLTMPALVTAGDGDFITLPRHGRAVAALLPNARFVELTAAGHLAALEQREEFNKQQESFVAEIGGSGR